MERRDLRVGMVFEGAGKKPSRGVIVCFTPKKVVLHDFYPETLLDRKEEKLKKQKEDASKLRHIAYSWFLDKTPIITIGPKQLWDYVGYHKTIWSIASGVYKINHRNIKGQEITYLYKGEIIKINQVDIYPDLKTDQYVLEIRYHKFGSKREWMAMILQDGEMECLFYFFESFKYLQYS